MPLLDIAASQPFCFFRGNNLAFRSEANFHNKLVVGNGRGLGFASTFSWKPFHITEKIDKRSNKVVWRRGLMIKAAATLDMSSVSRKTEEGKGFPNMPGEDVDSSSSSSSTFEPQSSSEDSTEVQESEKLRRMRISKANKGNTPWNKGRKHSPETLQRIKERTRLAMQNPKVKMKLMNLGHAQSEETRTKIGVGVRLRWERRRDDLMLQEMCYYKWRDLVAEAARKGISGDEELQWDSYKTLNSLLDQEWLQAVEERRHTHQNRNRPKSIEHKRKIADAIASKWTDPEYRNRILSSKAKFYSTPERVERKPKPMRKPSTEKQTRKGSPPLKMHDTDNVVKQEMEIKNHRDRLKRSKKQLYKDPFANSKLKMLRNIRAERAPPPVHKQIKAISRAKLLIGEAEQAAQALELAAKNNPHVQASLTETRMLIAEAIQFIQSVETGNPVPGELRKNATELLAHVEEDTDTQSKVNGVHMSLPGSMELNGSASNSCLHKTEAYQENAEEEKVHVKRIKKWVRGRLVEVVED